MIPSCLALYYQPIIINNNYIIIIIIIIIIITIIICFYRQKHHLHLFGVVIAHLHFPGLSLSFLSVCRVSILLLIFKNILIKDE